MAVYTEVSDNELVAFIAEYNLGEVVSCKGIAEGIENSNFLLRTEQGTFILTLYERRVNADELPFFIGLMEHLADRGVSCPTPVRGRDGQALRTLCGRPAALVTFLDGMWPRQVTPEHCLELGKAMARLHLAGADFAITRRNALTVDAWRPLLLSSASRAGEVREGLTAELGTELDDLEARWPTSLPAGVIHADLFPDNVFFMGNRLTGLIDFYFACNDFLAYDLAVCLNAWCFEKDGSFNATKARRLTAGYASVRPLSHDEMRLLPVLARGAAIRFLLTRLYDWLYTPANALVTRKDPVEYLNKLRFHRGVRGPEAYGLGMTGMDADNVVEVFTDGACSGNPGPGGWGAILRWRGNEKELSGGETMTTNNRMELMAAIAALEAQKRPVTIRLHTDSMYLRDGITKWIFAWKKNGWRTAGKDPVKNVDLWQRLDAALARHHVEWQWVRGHAGHPENERADLLAREAIAEIRRLNASEPPRSTP